MSGKPNVVFRLEYVQSGDKIKNNKTLSSKYGERRKFYSCNNGVMDYLRYVDEGTRPDKPNPIDRDYLEYSDNEEKGSGVFNGKGKLTKKERADLRNQLRVTPSTIWHGLISFEEAFGKRYCDSAEKAQRLMAIEFPRFLKSAGFDPDKIVWYAGLHENTDNLHVHLSFFEREPSRYAQIKKGLQFSQGRIAGRHFEQFKVAVELRLTDISSRIAASRKEVTDLFSGLLFSKKSKVRYAGEIQNKLQLLTQRLPPSGRIAYDSENMRELKPLINEIVNCIIKSNGRLYYQFEDYCSRIKDKDKKTLEILKASKIRETEWPRYMVADKYLNDIYRRLGNQIISSVRTIKNREKKTGNRLANKRIRRRTVLWIMEYALKLDSEIERDAMEAFSEYLERLENEKITIKGGRQSEME